MYKNKKIYVVGGGDSAVEHSLFLTKFSNVTLIHRRDTLRASTIMQRRLFANEKITVIFDTVITSLQGDTKLRCMTIKDLKTGVEQKVQVDGLFYGLGLTPNSEIFKGQLDMDSEGYLKTFGGTTQTSLYGIYACGDVVDKKYKQAVMASGDGCKAALDLEDYFHSQEE